MLLISLGYRVPLNLSLNGDSASFTLLGLLAALTIFALSISSSKSGLKWTPSSAVYSFRKSGECVLSLLFLVLVILSIIKGLGLS
jgi:hypothetical protein